VTFGALYRTGVVTYEYVSVYLGKLLILRASKVVEEIMT
jgi:hypothetical protein